MVLSDEFKICLYIASVPLFKYIISGRIINLNTIRTESIINGYAIGHFIQGFITGLLLGNGKLGISSMLRTNLFLFLACFYPTYNILKRVMNKWFDLFESSLFINLTDFSLGLVIGLFISNYILEKDKVDDRVDEVSKKLIKKYYGYLSIISIGIIICLQLISNEKIIKID